MAAASPVGKLVVDFIDSKLTANDARNGIITACQNDYAMVGTFALFLSNMDDANNCKDQAGAATASPTSPASPPVSSNRARRWRSRSARRPSTARTKDQNPQTYHGNQFDSKYLLKTHKNDLHGAMIVSGDTADANRGGTVLVDTAKQAGIKADQTGRPSAAATRRARTRRSSTR